MSYYEEMRERFSDLHLKCDALIWDMSPRPRRKEPSFFEVLFYKLVKRRKAQVVRFEVFRYTGDRGYMVVDETRVCIDCGREVNLDIFCPHCRVWMCYDCKWYKHPERPRGCSDCVEGGD